MTKQYSPVKSKSTYRQATIRSLRCFRPRYRYCARASQTTSRNFSLLMIAVDRFFRGFGCTLKPWVSYSFSLFGTSVASGTRPMDWSNWHFCFLGGNSLRTSSKTLSLICHNPKTPQTHSICGCSLHQRASPILILFLQTFNWVFNNNYLGSAILTTTVKDGIEI